MSNEHLSLKPYNLKSKKGTKAWIYEERGGLIVLCDPTNATAHLGTIPWRKVREALKRKDRKGVKQ